MSVSDHALVRYMERHLGVDVERIRDEIRADIDKPHTRKLIDFAGGRKCKVLAGKGAYCIRGRTVTTFYN
ncbi:MAG: hypothetical protein OXH09_17760 [Gammaproteobacteria bacterium]|nr:hypothetical protein [Gammaproteobacteria bacterium]